MTQPTVKIQSDGSPRGTSVELDGRELHGLQSFRYEVSIGHKPKLTLVFRTPADLISQLGELAATVAEDQSSPAAPPVLAGEATYGLAYPFVVAKSNGGEYDDEALVAGVQVGEVSAQLRAKPSMLEVTAYTSLRAQLDLVAMHAGYNLESMPDGAISEWTNYVFTSLDTAQAER